MPIRRYKGRHLKPRPKGRVPAAAGAAVSLWLAAPPAQAATHVVSSGETLTDIADRYGTSVGHLAKVNRLADPNLIVAGQRLRIPMHATVTSIHVVRPGETLSSIAGKYGTSVQSLAKRNHIRDPNLIFSGAKLRIASVPSRARSGGAGGAGGSIKESLEKQSTAHGVSTELTKAVAWQESGWRQNVVSSAGAIGVMQVMPGTARYVNRDLGGGNLKVRKADDNVHLGVMYLHHMMEVMPSERKALAAYYSGPGNVGRRLKDYQRQYVDNVQAIKRRFGR